MYHDSLEIKGPVTGAESLMLYPAENNAAPKLSPTVNPVLGRLLWKCNRLQITS